MNNRKIDKISQEIGEMEAKPRELCFVHNLAFFVKVYATTIFIQKIMIGKTLKGWCYTHIHTWGSYRHYSVWNPWEKWCFSLRITAQKLVEQ